MFLYYPDSLILPMCRLYVVGSLDGDFDRLLTIFNQFSMPPFTTYIFLG
uniref:Ovule protein n=1 Tax=Elaeophora elaphi TaxID=1147741 RepID=A0A0R3RKC3_9BILA